MKMELNKIYNEDCNITMEGLHDECIDLILTSPPIVLNKLCILCR